MYDALNSCVQHGHDSYMLNFHFLHIAGLSDTLVQLVGAVLNLDLDTLLDITPTNTSVEVAPPLLPPRSSTPSITTFISHCRGSAPRSSPPRTAGSWHKDITYTLLFPALNTSHLTPPPSRVVLVLVDTRPTSTPVFSSDEEINSPLNLESVLVTVRRFHSRYHSCLAALLYLFDLQVDRLTSVALRLVAELKAVEDALLFSAAEHSFAAMAQQPAPDERGECAVRIHQPGEGEFDCGGE